MFALVIYSIAVVYYAAPTIRRHCCRKNRRPVSAELVDAFKDL